MNELRADSDISRDVTNEVRWSPGIDETHIGIKVADGVVTLTGFVSTFVERCAAERAVKRVAGVRALANPLHVGDDLVASDTRDRSTHASAART